MKKALLFYMFLALTIHQGFSQYIQYDYYDNGNRKSRNVITMKSTCGNNEESDSTEIFTETTKEFSVNIFPNPVTDNLFVEIKGLKENHECIIQLYNLSGKLVTYIETKEASISVPFKEIPSGLYIMQIQFGKEVSEWKIIRE